MKKSNIILVGLGYLAGLVVATKFAKPGTSKSLGEIGEELGTIHKNLWTEAETHLFSPENRDRIASMKSEAIREIKLFQEEGETFATDLMKKWDMKREEILEKLEELYAEREELFDTLLSDGKSLAEEALESGDEVGKKLKKKIDSVIKDLKKEFSKTLIQIKKKIK